ncbi:hypothetical protein VV02_12420 [Luteipulveratus mongoliensis]|uniref:DUF1203 domain-containing protein n=2 Tax=Luteipulveratus mongoliensis TaxID=571913 RepID=A0A0K1JQK8_9MICO|nr:hypothetical protein VV02_12420 [Luteipulveratus mongoliensis]
MKAIWHSGLDQRGNTLRPQRHEETFPLRCCLRQSELTEEIALISYAPLQGPSPWAEVGPVFVHATPCDGYDSPGLPEAMRIGSKVLRSYRADGSLDYDGIVVAEPDADLEPLLEDLLADPARAEVHVRSLTAQCFTYRVTRSGEAPLT